MTDLRSRTSVRLPNFDYRNPACYFITLCAIHRKLLFGKITDRKMNPSEYGKIVTEEWKSSEFMRDNFVLDTFVVMPNHVHGVVLIDRHPAAEGVQARATGRSPLRPKGPARSSLGAFVSGFKSAVTRRIRIRSGNPLVEIWQRNYYEHVIRDDDEFYRIREYIELNPANWRSDPENVGRSESVQLLPWEKHM